MIQILRISPFWQVITLSFAIFSFSNAKAQEHSSERILLAQSKLSASLIQHLQSSSKDIAIVSPAGSAMAIALLSLGANANFRESAQSFLGFDSNRGADQDLEYLRRASANIMDVNQSSPFQMAAAAVLDPRLDPNLNAIAQMRQSGAEVWIQSLGDQSTIQAINEWVSTKTRGLIKGIVDSAIGEGGLVILNALYFKDDWAVGFDNARTELSHFHGADGAITSVPMMRGTVRASVRMDGRFAGATLAYKSARFSLTLITTRDTPAYFSEFDNIESWFNESSFQPSQLNIQLPRLQLRMSSNLMNSLDASSLGSAFLDRSTFLPLTSKPIRLGGILQKVYFKIDEQGSEAAATTAILGRSFTAAPAGMKSISFDKPFAFALRDRLTGMFLLAGYVGRILTEHE